MEKQLFLWETWDVVDTMLFQFETCELKVPIGDFSAGTKVPTISLDYEHALITIYTEEGTGYVYPLKLAV